MCDVTRQCREKTRKETAAVTAVYHRVEVAVFQRPNQRRRTKDISDLKSDKEDCDIHGVDSS